MKSLTLFALFALLFAGTVFSQKKPAAAPQIDSFELGIKTVQIPAPVGFTEIFSRFDIIPGRIRATEDPGLETLAAHLPTSLVPKYAADEQRSLDFYTKLSVSKTTKTADVSLKDFATLIAETEKQLAGLLDPDSPLLKKIEGNTSKGLSDFWGKVTTVKINQPKNLGVFDRGDNVYSTLLFVSGETDGKKYSRLATFSLVRVNERLVLAYVYKSNPTQADIAIITTFAKKWTAAILAANK